ncbi:hypothetical protein HELRODRAFT_116640 [Helobdella robusta]|uniref:TatD related DNase n=1 Tax=Helobdella robusta TaxID=6412 RepID=T1EGG8_HELRO|nr:hypothetical protein HELRODRAFT_116640 [Helobdella robusta]ESN90007.1 hypothetical protein HELRODRAFT_116640 [Helobdella robusta]
MSLKYIDCHNHIYAEEFNEDREQVIEEAKKSGVLGMITVSEFVTDTDKILNLADRHPNFCFPSLGVHPVQETNDVQRSATIEDFLQMKPEIVGHAERLVCIGEIGLDFTPRVCHSESDKESQRLVFSEQIKLAGDHDLPINVHSRSAGRPVVKLLKELNATKVLLHAFDGKPSVALEGVQSGYFFSVPPSIARSEQKVKIVKALPIENLLLETDCPALGPEKMVRNNPSNVKISCEFISKLKNIDADLVSQIILENSIKLFPKLNLR